MSVTIKTPKDPKGRVVEFIVQKTLTEGNNLSVEFGDKHFHDVLKKPEDIDHGDISKELSEAVYSIEDVNYGQISYQTLKVQRTEFSEWNNELIGRILAQIIKVVFPEKIGKVIEINNNGEIFEYRCPASFQKFHKVDF